MPAVPDRMRREIPDGILKKRQESVRRKGERSSHVEYFGGDLAEKSEKVHHRPVGDR